MPTEPTALSTLIDLINTSGVLGLLIFFVWAFYNGEIISKKSLDRILEGYRSQTEAMFQKAINDVLSEIRKKGW